MSEEVTIKNEIEAVVVGSFRDPVSNTEKLLTVRTQDDGTLRFYALQVAIDSAGVERPLLAEPNRALGVSLHATDPDGDIAGLRANTKKQLQVEVVGLSIATLFAMVLLELRLTNIHLGQVSGLTEATTDDVEGND